MSEEQKEQISLVVNKQMMDAIVKLKKEFGVTSNAAVIRKSLALADYATANMTHNHTITFLDKNDEKHNVILIG